MIGKFPRRGNEKLFHHIFYCFSCAQQGTFKLTLRPHPSLFLLAHIFLLFFSYSSIVNLEHLFPNCLTAISTKDMQTCFWDMSTGTRQLFYHPEQNLKFLQQPTEISCLCKFHGYCFSNTLTRTFNDYYSSIIAVFSFFIHDISARLGSP